MILAFAMYRTPMHVSCDDLHRRIPEYVVGFKGHGLEVRGGKPDGARWLTDLAVARRDNATRAINDGPAAGPAAASPPGSTALLRVESRADPAPIGGPESGAPPRAGRAAARRGGRQRTYRARRPQPRAPPPCSRAPW